MSVFNDQDKIQLLSDLVGIKSVNGNELEVAQYLKTFLEKHDIPAEIITLDGDRVNLTAEIGQGAPVLAITGHMDVVDPGNLDQWTVDPFTLSERDGNLYGRGSTDMKGGLAAMVIAMIELHAQGLPKKGTLRLLATAGEEVGEMGSAAFHKSGAMKDVDGLIVGEPSGFSIAYAQKGSIDLRLTSLGKAAHSSMPEKGFNAIDPLINLIHAANKRFRAPMKNELTMGPVVFNTTIIHGGVQVNAIPDQASAEINIRTIPEFDNEHILATLKELIAEQNAHGAKIEMEVLMNEPFVAKKADNQLVKEALESLDRVTGETAPVIATPGITDASNLLRDTDADFPFIIFGPGNDTPHQINEFVPKTMYLQFSDIYIDLFIRFLN